MPAPSLQALKREFPDLDAKHLRRLLTSMPAVDADPAVIAWEGQCYHRPAAHERRLCAINAALNGFGVERVNSSGRSPSFDYINMGDPYVTTIIRTTGGHYAIGTWGDRVERGTYG